MKLSRTDGILLRPGLVRDAKNDSTMESELREYTWTQSGVTFRILWIKGEEGWKIMSGAEEL